MLCLVLCVCDRYKKYQRGSVLSYAQLLFDCILNTRWKYNIDILRDELLNLYEVELRGRRLCRDYGVTKKHRLQVDNFEPGQELECSKVTYTHTLRTSVAKWRSKAGALLSDGCWLTFL